MQSVKYLQQVQEKFGLNSATALAVKLGLSKQAISNYLNGNRVMDEETCLAVALALDINPLEVMMAAGIDRAEKAGQKSLWEVFMSRTAATAATLALATSAVNLFLTPGNAEAATMRISDASIAKNIDYANMWRNGILEFARRPTTDSART